MKTIKLAGLEIPIHDGPIGVSVSGGADSSLLLYILMKYATGPIHAINMCCKSMNRMYTDTVVDVLGFCIDDLKREDVYLHIHFLNSHHPIHTANALHTYILDKKVKAVYTGISSTPSKEVLATEFNISLDEKIALARNPDLPKLPPIFPECNSPFYKIDKKKIAEIYAELNLTDKLFPLTRSCYNPKVATGHCKVCWWCEERRWAFGKYQ